MAASIFSTYSTGENRVTASILAVLRSLSLGRIERLLGAIMEQSEFELVRFINQPSKGAPGVPDAEISSSCRLLIETKIKRGTVRRDQVERHLRRLDESGEETRVLLVLTPDDDRPAVLDKVKDSRVVWASFSSLDQAINELLADDAQVVSEREAFLLRELQAMLEAEGLIGSPNDVVVVPARRAWPEYNRVSAYVCQANRTFQAVKRIAFYSGGQIHPRVPEIEEIHEAVPLVRKRHKGRLRALVDALLDEPEETRRVEGHTYKVFILTPPDDERTLALSASILNDLTAKTGRTVAFTQNQRYVSEQKLTAAKKTSDLIEE